MATKKQKREAALAKREVWLAELAEENLIALAKNRAPDGCPHWGHSDPARCGICTGASS